MIALYDRRHVVGDVAQAAGEVASRRGFDAAIGSTTHLAMAFFDDAPSRMCKTGVDTEDNRAPTSLA